MSSDPLSDVHDIPVPRASRRVGFRNPISSPLLTSPKTTSESPLPLDAAMSVSAGYIATLHSGLTPPLTAISRESLSAYYDYDQSTAKAVELEQTPHYVSTSVKKIKLNLQPLDEQKGSEGFQALQSKLDAVTDEFHQKLMREIVIPHEALKRQAYEKRFHLSVCRLLRKAAHLFMALLNIRDYDEDKAVIDLLSTQNLDTILTPPLPLDLSQFLQIYKEAHVDVTSTLPQPTVYNKKVIDIINNINSKKLPIIHQSPGSSLSTTASNSSANPASGTPNSSQNETVNIITPHTGNSTHQLALPPRMEVQQPQVPPPPNMMQIVQPTTPPQGIRNTEFITAATANNVLAETLINNLAELANQFTEDSEVDHEREDREHELSRTTENQDALETQDEPLQDLDLDGIVKEASFLKVLGMIRDFYIHAVKLPIDEYHSSVTKREELLRVKRAAAVVLKSSLASKVASKIQAERPADRPVLQGLIREETEKQTALLWSHLKSATDQMAHVQQKQRQFMSDQPRRHQPAKTSKRPAHFPTSTHSTTPKNRGGSNNTNKWTRNTSKSSVVAAAGSRSFQTSAVITPLPQADRQQQWGRKRPPTTSRLPTDSTPSQTDNQWEHRIPPPVAPHPQSNTTPTQDDNQWGRKRSPISTYRQVDSNPSTEETQWGRKRPSFPLNPNVEDSPTVGDNASSAARRTKNNKKRRSNNKAHNNTGSS